MILLINLWAEELVHWFPFLVNHFELSSATGLLSSELFADKFARSKCL